ncbi:hypothetical protein HK405_002656, partial [Cladochytrium tenue]
GPQQQQQQQQQPPPPDARAFLTALGTLAELGFPRERIAEALLVSGIDVDRALAYLVQ